MGLFDSIIGSANEEAEPLDMWTITEEPATASMEDVVSTLATDTGTGDTSGSTGGGTGDTSGASTGGATGDTSGSSTGDTSGSTGGVIDAAIPTIDIGMEFFGTDTESSSSADVPVPNMAIATESVVSDVEQSAVSEGSPLEDMTIPTVDIGGISLPTEEVSPITEEVTVTPVESFTPALEEVSVAPIATESAFSIETPVQQEVESFDDKVEDFVSELEELKAKDDALIQEKEAEIAELEKEASALEKEVKKIQAEEKKIETAIGSLTGKAK